MQPKCKNEYLFYLIINAQTQIVSKHQIKSKYVNEDLMQGTCQQFAFAQKKKMDKKFKQG